MKNLIRTEIKRIRLSSPPSQSQSDAIIDNLKPLLCGRIALYYPLKGQINLLKLLNENNYKLSLPRVVADSKCLSFNQIGKDSKLTKSLFGTKVSDGQLVIPNIVICPMLAFNSDLHRIGYGAGYYDRTLKTLSQTLRIGVALQNWLRTFEAQKQDVRMDILVTESLVRRCK